MNNILPSTLASPGSTSKCWTEEQNAIIHADSLINVVNAGAGTGKTATLIGLAKNNPTKNYYYLAYNKAIAEDAKKRFSAEIDSNNVRIMTIHAIAYQAVGRKYTNRLGNLRLFDAIDIFKKTLNAKENNYSFTKRVIDDFHEYCNSNHSSIDNFYKQKTVLTDDTKKSSLDDRHNGVVAIWNSMADVQNTCVVEHDFYLKSFALQAPRLDGDVLLCDEYQDVTPVIESFINRQPHQQFRIGDVHQQIYRFRGAVNALERATEQNKNVSRYNLTQSFRFDDSVAWFANVLLKTVKDESRILRGSKNHPSVYLVQKNKPYTVLGRTNFFILDYAYQCIMDDVPFGFIGSIEGYRLSLVSDALALKENRISDIRDSHFKRFKNFDDFCEAAEESDDIEMKTLVNILNKWGDQAEHIIKSLRNKNINCTKKGVSECNTRPHVLLTTAHKAKGLEFDQVLLLDDFSRYHTYMDQVLTESNLIKRPPWSSVRPDIFEMFQNTWQDIDDEVNLLYVAITRTHGGLLLPQELERWMGWIRHQQKIIIPNKRTPYLGWTAKNGYDIMPYRNNIVKINTATTNPVAEHEHESIDCKIHEINPEQYFKITQKLEK